MFYYLKIFIVIILTGFLGFIILKPDEAIHSRSKSELIIGAQFGYPPFEFMDSKGNTVGFDVDLAQLIAEKMNKKLVIKDLEFEGLILSLKQGKIDLIISGMNITPSRLKEIAMVPYHGDKAKSLSLIFWNEIPEGISSINDIANLANPIVSVEVGAIPEEYIKKYPKIQAKALQGALAPLIDVKFGKSTANLVEPDVADYLKSQHPEINILSVPFEEGEEISGFGIGIKKENILLTDEVAHIVQELKSSGQLAQLESKWFKGGE